MPEPRTRRSFRGLEDGAVPARAGAGTARRVCVIGAGISGLVTTKVLVADGFDVVAYEREPHLGGVWAPLRTYPGLRANNSRESYAFSDFPYPETAEEFPTAEDVRRYLSAYVATFHLTPRLRLGVGVTHVLRAGCQFHVSTRSVEGWRETQAFDFVVVCTGVFSHPHVPMIPGQKHFGGPIRHSSDLDALPLTTHSRVVVVGGGKSAFDCATWAAGLGCRTTLVCRSAHWMAPRRVFGLVRSDRVFLTRAFELFLPYHRQTRFERVLHGPLRIVLHGFWRLQSALLRAALNLPDVLVPPTSLPQGFEYLGVGEEFYEAVEDGRIQVRLDHLDRVLGPTRLALASGETLDADVVIHATGWRLTLPTFSEDLREAVLRNGQLHLYRHILPPRHQALGFVGFASSTANGLTSEMAAHWLSHVFQGRLALGSPDHLDAEITRVLAWSAATFPGRPEGQFLGPYVTHYLDDLLGDMGLPTRRSRLWLTEFFGPCWPSRYAAVGAERRRATRRAS